MATAGSRSAACHRSLRHDLPGLFRLSCRHSSIAALRLHFAGRNALLRRSLTEFSLDKPIWPRCALERTALQAGREEPQTVTADCTNCAMTQSSDQPE